MDNQLQPQKHSDEIDLIELFNRMGRAFIASLNWILMNIKTFILFIIKKSLWLVLFSIIGGFIGYYFYNSTPRFYSSEMVARSNSINNSVLINSINLLNDLFDNKNYTALSNYLGTTSNEAEKIKSIDAFYGIDINRDKIADYIDYTKTYNPKDTTQKRIADVFYIKISVFDETVFPNLRDGIKKYISTNPYILKNNEIRKQQAVSLIKEIKILDSLQKELYFDVPKMQKSGNSQTVLLNDKVSNLYHKDLIDLYKKKQELEKDLALNPDPITIIQDFTQLSKADNPLVKYLKTWVISFAILGFIFTLLWHNRKLIWTLIKT